MTATNPAHGGGHAAASTPSRPAAVPTLFVHYSDDPIRGSEVALLDLLGALDRARFDPILWCNTPAMSEAARAIGVTTHHAPMRFSRAPTVPLLSAAADRAALRDQRATAVALARRHRVRLIHANSGAPVQWLVPAARDLRLPLLAHLHAPYLRRDRYILFLHGATLAAGVSGAVTEGLLTDGMHPARVRRIPNGVNPARLGPERRGLLRARLGIPPGAFVAGSVGSLIPRKGCDVLMRGFARLPGASWLVLAGSGPEEARLRALAAELGVSGRVRFVGNLDQPAEVFDSLDVHVLASRAEAFGLVLVEAALRGVPSIGTTVGGIPEIIGDGTTGLLVSPDDPEALAVALRRLADDPALRRRLGAGARAAAEDRFTAIRMADEVAETYEEMLKMPPSRLGWSALRHDAAPWFRAAATLLRRGRA